MNYQTQMKLKRLFNQPLVTYLLLGITTLVFLGMELSGGSTSSQVLIDWGAMSRAEIIYLHEYWRLFTPMFLHIGWLHFVVNMVTLYYVGSQVESIYGHWRYLAIYLLSGVAGNIASFAFGSQNAISAGASTSLFGLFGAFVILGRHFRNNPAISFMVQRYATFIGINLIFNLFSSQVDIMGHIGGLIGGFLTATVLAVPDRSDEFNIHERIISGIFFVFLLGVCFVLGFKKYS
ncbi:MULTISPECIES: rhomboid family intramembrane serine protease [unclassified Enterococcus]|uniref:rhomboid family intramembrane serine protease n=1 Tax=unclassified Enterococcus TaxID=2608891 RepID=UPI001CE20AF3|nr:MULTISPECIES: rhomboid family intramembrane serine protease [unclassified Enterococcus]MCA5011447.1 rhomboid family intramembrane serine protease [Enterococcus sp. S23]MCA5015111.1 rhomboid family intramembrane serine protease [Enterococcus sp. S22(2020)]